MYNRKTIGSLLLLTGITGLVFAMNLARAATYNFYFNNLEQGHNSTANPKLFVTQKGKKKKVESSEKGSSFIQKSEGSDTEESSRVDASATAAAEQVDSTTTAEPASEEKHSTSENTEKVEVKETVDDSLTVPPAALKESNEDDGDEE